MPLRKFASHHDRMIELSKTILSLARSGQPEAMTELQRSRVALSRIIADHCSAEIAHIPEIPHDPHNKPEKTRLVRRYHSELLAWRCALMECNASWPTRRISEQPTSFASVFGKLFEQLRERIRWEEEEFYPVIFGATTRR